LSAEGKKWVQTMACRRIRADFPAPQPAHFDDLGAAVVYRNFCVMAGARGPAPIGTAARRHAQHTFTASLAGSTRWRHRHLGRDAGRQRMAAAIAAMACAAAAADRRVAFG